MINNRQAGRRRGRGGNNGGGNGPRQGGQRDNGNRIDSRARGNANQLYEKYKNLAAEAQRQGDRVNTEYYLQFADHYFRVLSEARSRFEEQNQQNQQRRQRDDGYDARPFTGSFDTGFDGQDDDFADEGEPIRAGEQSMGDDRAERPVRPDREDRGERRNGPATGQPPRRDERARDERPRDENRYDDQPGDGSEQARERTPRAEGDGQVRRPRRIREDGPAVPAAAAEMPVVRSEVPASLPQAAEAAEPTVPEAEAPRRRGRPRRERPEESAPGFDAALLPPSLGIAPEVTTGEAPAEAEAKPRRRRVRTAPAEVTQAG